MVGLAAHFLDTPAGGLASLTGLTSLNTLAADAYAPAIMSAAQAAAHWAATSDRDDVISLMTGLRSRQNSYCSHGSRWSYSSHVEQSLGNLRSVSRLDSSNGTRSCRNSLLAATLGVPASAVASAHSPVNGHLLQNGQQETQFGVVNHEAGSLSEDVSLWPPDYLVRKVVRDFPIYYCSCFCLFSYLFFCRRSCFVPFCFILLFR